MPGFWVEGLIERANAQGADIIVGLGDYVRKRNTPRELQEVWPMLRRLRAPLGVYFVNGNHDHWADQPLSLRLLEESGFSLRHRHKVIQKGGASIVIAGAGDFYEDEVGIEAALRGAKAEMFKIVLTHNPDSIDTPHQSRVDLFLAGHTHGGQVRLPFVDYAPVIPVKNKGYDYGLRQNSKGEAIYISKGVGWAILPLRFNTRPEMPILVLRRSDEP